MRVVLGWELGGNWGHARRLGAIAGALAEAGHEVHLVLQRPVEGRGLAGGRAALWQAPLWRGLFRYGGLAPLGQPRRHGDLLANLGLRDSAEVEGILRAWDSLLAQLRPDAAVADFAPGLVMAARGRLPVVAVGTGLTVPPTHLPEFPTLPGASDPPLVAEAALLAMINRARRNLGRDEEATLTAALRAGAELPAVFAVLDPYRAQRQGPRLPPFVPAGVPGPVAGPGTPPRVFAYLPAGDLSPGTLRTLAALGPLVPVTAVMPGLDARGRALLGRAGIVPSDRPLDWATIRRDHSVVLCAGGMGTVSSALLTGMPLVVLPSGVEQVLTARALRAAGLSPDPGPDPAGRIAALAHDHAARARAETAAQGFRQSAGDPVAGVVSALERLEF